MHIWCCLSALQNTEPYSQYECGKVHLQSISRECVVNVFLTADFLTLLANSVAITLDVKGVKEEAHGNPCPFFLVFSSGEYENRIYPCGVCCT